jgi:hypothetical protein
MLLLDEIDTIDNECVNNGSTDNNTIKTRVSKNESIEYDGVDRAFG